MRKTVAVCVPQVLEGVSGVIVTKDNSFKKTVEELSYDPLVMYLMELKLGSQRDHCHPILTAVFWITSKRHRQIKCPEVNKWKRKYNIYNVEKEKKILYIYIYTHTMYNIYNIYKYNVA